MADMNCSAVTIKYLIFIFNLLFVLIGIIFISVGVSVKEYYSDYVAFLDNQYFSAPNFLIAIGSIIFFIAFLGCCGAIKQNFCMLTTFTGLLIVIFIFEFSAGIAGYVLRNQTEEYLETTLEASIDDYQPNSQSVNEVTYVWDLIQKDFECCGANSYEFFFGLRPHGGRAPLCQCGHPRGPDAHTGVDPHPGERLPPADHHQRGAVPPRRHHAGRGRWGQPVADGDHNALDHHRVLLQNQQILGLFKMRRNNAEKRKRRKHTWPGSHMRHERADISVTRISNSPPPEQPGYTRALFCRL